MISFTGSVETGSAIMAAAAANITKVNLELGGKAPAIVMADADIDLAVKADQGVARHQQRPGLQLRRARLRADRKVADEFVEKLAAAMKSTRYGDPLARRDGRYGPAHQRGRLQQGGGAGRGAVAAGATVVTGGKRAPARRLLLRADGARRLPPGHGDRPPRDLRPGGARGHLRRPGRGDRVRQRLRLRADLVIYTRDLNVALRACQEIRFGETYINRENFEAMQGFHAGWRKSGIGGADGKHGLYEYTQTHVVYMQRY